VPEGPHSIAIMRLVVQAQAEEKQRSIIGAFSALGPEDRKVLCEEMAQSGIAGQFFERSSRVGIDSARCSEADDASPSETRPKILEEPLKSKGGPAILVYYSPAFLRTLTPDEALPALGLLAEIYRRARQLWPSKPDLTGSVTVRIDQVKELKLSEVQHAYSFGDTWVLTRRNDLEAVLERIPLDLLAERPKDKTKVRICARWTNHRWAHTLAHALGSNFPRHAARLFLCTGHLFAGAEVLEARCLAQGPDRFGGIACSRAHAVDALLAVARIWAFALRALDAHSDLSWRRPGSQLAMILLAGGTGIRVSEPISQPRRIGCTRSTPYGKAL
jgi:hypothetical protein